MLNGSIIPLTPKRVALALGAYIVTPPEGISEAAMSDFRKALCHESYTRKDEAQRLRINKECREGCVPVGEHSYERLEYLGDSILCSVVSAYLFRRYPREDEGFMTHMRTHLVNGKMLARLCQRGTCLVPHIAVSSELEARHAESGVAAIGKKQPRYLSYKILEDVFEAFIGATFVHFGFSAAQEWVVGCLEKNVDFADLTARKDTPRAVLNRYCQTSYGFHPELQTLKEGVVRLMNPLTGQVVATGHGDTHKTAVSDAVSNALEYYNVSLYVT